MSRSELNDAAIDQLAHDPEGEVAQAIERAAYVVENAAKASLLRPGSGGIYGPGIKFFRRGAKLYRWERIGTHQASAPGEPASSDTGQLLASVEHVMDEDDSGIFYRIGSREKHAEYTELGTRFMFPRPWLRPALDAAGGEVGDNYQRGLFT